MRTGRDEWNKLVPAVIIQKIVQEVSQGFLNDFCIYGRERFPIQLCFWLLNHEEGKVLLVWREKREHLGRICRTKMVANSMYEMLV